MTQLIVHLASIADEYDLFLVDQWGVLHDGAKAHPDARDALRALRQAEKRVVLISNSSKRATVSVARLEALGIERDAFDGLVTSGELGWQAMRERTAAWLRRYLALAPGDGRPAAERAEAMNRVNPKYVLRNYLAQLAIDAAEQSDFSQVVELLDVVRRPYDEQPGYERYATKRPEWARERAGCSQLSCSS